MIRLPPDISEFSYGFALTHQLVKMISATASPIFPNLFQEGQAGGGYDVSVQSPTRVIYLQFKLSHLMKTKRAVEYGFVARAKQNDQSIVELSTPFRRFEIMEAKKSNQHELLMDLETKNPGRVFYAAPDFHSFEEIDEYFLQEAIAENSVFFRPSDIGPLPDGRHTVCWDGSVAYACSEPQALVKFNANEVAGRNSDFSSASSEPFYEVVNQAADDLLKLTKNVRLIKPEAKREREGRLPVPDYEFRQSSAEYSPDQESYYAEVYKFDEGDSGFKTKRGSPKFSKLVQSLEQRKNLSQDSEVKDVIEVAASVVNLGSALGGMQPVFVRDL